MKMSIDNYLARIGYQGDLTQDAATLAALQTAHLKSVPYENLDLYFRRPFTLAYGELYDKIVNRHRGGYCFELNGLFAWLLRALGYRTEEYLGRWLKGEALQVPMRRHRVVKVFTKEGIFLADVGVGQRSPLTPLEFRHDVIQTREGVNYRIVKDERRFNVVQVETEAGFIDFFSFDEAPQENIDYEYPHFYCTHCEQSVFLHKLMVHIPTDCGRNSISSEPNPETGLVTPLLSVGRQDGTSEKSFIYSNKELCRVLDDCFGIPFEC